MLDEYFPESCILASALLYMHRRSHIKVFYLDKRVLFALAILFNIAKKFY